MKTEDFPRTIFELNRWYFSKWSCEMSFDRGRPRFDLVAKQALLFGMHSSVLVDVDVFHVRPVASGTNRGNFSVTLKMKVPVHEI